MENLDTKLDTLERGLLSINLIKRFITFFLFFFVLYLVIVLVNSVILNTISNNTSLVILDTYLQIILKSWPSTVLILGFLLFLTQRESISFFIKFRLKSVGPDGVKSLGKEDYDQILSKQQISNEGILLTKSDETEVIKLEHGSLEVENQKLLQQLGFEKIYNVIFQTQIEILINLRKNVIGLNYKVIASVYELWRENDEVLKNYPLADYLNFIQIHELVNIVEVGDERTYYITNKGIDFLNYIEMNKYPQKNH